MSVRVLGIKETMKELKDLAPDIHKEFRRNVRVIVKPIIDQTTNLYDGQEFPSGTARKWKYRFPLDASKAKKGVSSSIRLGRKNASTILIIQKNAGGAIFEFANTGSLGEAFRSKTSLRPGRVVWRATDNKLDAVVKEMTELVQNVEREVYMRIKG